MNRKYTQEHVDWISANIQGTKFKDLTAMFNERFGMSLSVPAMVSMTAARGLHNGINVVPEFIENGKLHRYRKGHAPANKGIKGTHSSPATEFKKGNIPVNFRPVGSERISVDGYTEVKVADPNKWRMKHAIIWEAANGPVPKKHVVIFGDGNKQNFALENLLLVSQAQLLALNRKHLIQNNVDLTKTGILIVDVDRKIHERRNPMKSKITDEEIFALIDEGKKNAEIARHFGVSQPSINKRINNLRSQHESKISKEKIEPAKLPDGFKPINEVIKEFKEPQNSAIPFPFYQDESILYCGTNYTVVRVDAERLVIRENATLKSKYFTPEEYEKNKTSFRKKEKPPIKTAGEDIALKNRKTVPAAGDIEVDGKPIKELPDADKEKITDKLKDDAAQFQTDREQERKIKSVAEKVFAPEKPIEELFQPDPVEAAIESAPADAGPLHIDLELDNITDSEWGAAEKEISDTVLSRRDYLDKIDQLLDLVAPIYKSHKDVAFKTKGLAISILVAGIDREAGA